MSTRQYWRDSIEFPLQVLTAYVNREGSLKGIARRCEISHRLALFWPDKQHPGALPEEDNFEERVGDYEAKIVASERKVGQPAIELDVLKNLGSSARSLSGGKVSIVSGPAAVPAAKDANP